ncbi:hypothetical protein ACFQZ4_11515 [Catellatospora coxensis]|uniref:Uncharacterized protein n=1 Tax=Catellatospora coxensis TaxID=310354 RepID=A0A8J3KVT0_9ACTN|nr:hypothetical protein [Catellatospora coxensis]GIG07093.1 hypothetical protein Cco03nite_37930 [Catellatospora coxensis]
MSVGPSTFGPGLRAAIKDACLPEHDARGLMPLATARQWLAGRTVYEQGTGAISGGRHVLESDTTWAALVSLADAAEFVAQARRLRWRFHVRGKDNIALMERYGGGVLPWLADRVDEHGVLHNVPWCVLPCLLASGAPEAFDIAARVRAVTEQLDTRTWRSAGCDTEVLGWWVVRHPEPGYRLLAQRAEAADEVGVAAVGALFRTDPRGTAQRLAAAVGEVAARTLLDRLGLIVPPLPERVRALLEQAPVLDVAAGAPVSLTELDEVFEDGLGPMWTNANYYCAAMRLTGFAVPGGTDGLVFQSVTTGLADANVELEFHRFGFGLPAGPQWSLSRELLGGEEAERLAEASGEEQVTLPNGVVRLGVRPVAVRGRLDALMVALTAGRAERDRVFLDGTQLKQAVGLPETARELFVLDAWDHADLDDRLPSEWEDIVLAVEALRGRRAITRSVTEKSRDAHLRERAEILGGWA